MTSLSLTEIEAVLNASDVCTRTGIRNRAVLPLGFATGLHLAALFTLSLTPLTFQPIPSIYMMRRFR